MRTDSFWDRLIDSRPLGYQICTGVREGFLEILEQLGPACSVETVSHSKGIRAQAELFIIEEEQWLVIFIPLATPQPAIVIENIVQRNSKKITWIFLEKMVYPVPESCEILKAYPPSREQWDAVVKKFIPQFNGEILLPVDLMQAADFLKSLSLTGEYPGDREICLEGTAWKKFEQLAERTYSDSDVSLSDLLHVTHCLESIHKKAAFPGRSQSQGFIPQCFAQKITRDFSMVLNERALPYYIQMLQSIQALNITASHWALSQWLLIWKG